MTAFLLSCFRKFCRILCLATVHRSIENNVFQPNPPPPAFSTATLIILKVHPSPSVLPHLIRIIPPPRAPGDPKSGKSSTSNIFPCGCVNFFIPVAFGESKLCQMNDAIPSSRRAERLGRAQTVVAVLYIRTGPPPGRRPHVAHSLAPQPSKFNTTPPPRPLFPNNSQTNLFQKHVAPQQQAAAEVTRPRPGEMYIQKVCNQQLHLGVVHLINVHPRWTTENSSMEKMCMALKRPSTFNIVVDIYDQTDDDVWERCELRAQFGLNNLQLRGVAEKAILS
ncbi:hypothetical protein QBC36DRAFT_377500 [Triangularia setosa]|uniref:Uncharacterized protein n=1 Tax=Triangularia setosa TaxID=2587417 RepID=A0AAN6W928_9PEZI|nr:hypothetical protein QBC36DRAFT_377500 [Podospora setosa]